MYDIKLYHKYKDYYQHYKARKILCECGVNIGYGQLSVHRKTKKHIKLMKTLPSEKIEVQEVQEVVEVFCSHNESSH